MIDGSYLWNIERFFSLGSFATIAYAFVLPPTTTLDTLLGIFVPINCFFVFEAIITDYFPKRKFSITNKSLKTALLICTITSIAAIRKFNTDDVGISKGVRMLWNGNQKH